MELPRDLKYTNTHEWIRVEDSEIVVGITDFAQEQLSELTFVDLPSEGDTFSGQDEVAVLESVKAASDVYAPVSGTITSVNSQLLDHPTLVNSEPFAGGWVFRMKPDDMNELSHLMDADEYEELLPGEE